MSCPNCERLKKKLSPLEDKEFTERYKGLEDRKWMREHLSVRNGEPCVMLSLVPLFEHTFEVTPNNYELTMLGRTLVALGFERTYRGGHLFFAMSLEEFDRDYT